MTTKSIIFKLFIGVLLIFISAYFHTLGHYADETITGSAGLIIFILGLADAL